MVGVGIGRGCPTHGNCGVMSGRNGRRGAVTVTRSMSVSGNAGRNCGGGGVGSSHGGRLKFSISSEPVALGGRGGAGGIAVPRANNSEARPASSGHSSSSSGFSSRPPRNRIRRSGLRVVTRRTPGIVPTGGTHGGGAVGSGIGSGATNAGAGGSRVAVVVTCSRSASSGGGGGGGGTPGVMAGSSGPVKPGA